MLFALAANSLIELQSKFVVVAHVKPDSAGGCETSARCKLVTEEDAINAVSVCEAGANIPCNALSYITALSGCRSVETFTVANINDLAELLGTPIVVRAASRTCFLR